MIWSEKQLLLPLKNMILIKYNLFCNFMGNMHDKLYTDEQ